MKKLNYLLSAMLLLSVFALTGCGDDDDGETSASIIGTWVLASDSFEGCDDPAENDSNTYTCSETSCNRLTITATTITIAVISEFGSFDSELPYTQSGNTITVAGEAATVTVTDTSLTLFVQEDDEGCTVTTVYTRES